MEFSYCYRITYESGETYDRKKDLLVVEISKEDYKKIISGVLQGISAIKKNEKSDRNAGATRRTYDYLSE